MVNITRTYKSGTLLAAPTAGSNRVHVNPLVGGRVSTNDVGRLFKITSGDAKNQWRVITGVEGTAAPPPVVNQYYILSHSLDTSNLPGFTDVNPAIGATYTVSWYSTEIRSAFSTADITTLSSIHDQIQNVFFVNNNALVYFKGRSVIFNSQNIQIGPQGGIIFGSYGYVPGEIGYANDLCNLIDTSRSRGGEQMRQDNTQKFGHLEVWGGQIIITSGKTNSQSEGEGPFWRLYDETPDNNSLRNNCVRLINLRALGKFAGRGTGQRSQVILSEVSSDSTIGPFNPIDGIPYTISAASCRQTAYTWLARAKTSDTTILRASDITSQVMRVDAGGGGDANHNGNDGIHLIRGKYNELRATRVATFLRIERINTTNNARRAIFRYANRVSPRFINADTSLFNGTYDIAIFDKDYDFTDMDHDEHVFHQTVTGTGGRINFDARRTDMRASQTGLTASDATQEITLADGTDYFPYDLFAVTYGRQIVHQVMAMEDTFDPDLTFLVDPEVTETDYDTVGAYHTLETPEKIYDGVFQHMLSQFRASQSYYFNLHNYTGMGRVYPFVRRSGRDLDFINNDVRFVTYHDQSVTYQIGDLVAFTPQGGQVGFYTSDVVQSGGFVPAEWTLLSDSEPPPIDFEPITSDSSDLRVRINIYLGGAVTPVEPIRMNIRTTGIVSNQNHRLIDGAIIDRNADSALVFSGIDSWRLWNTHADQVACRTEVARGNVLDNYRFNYMAGQNFSLELRIGQSFVIEQVAVLEAGITNVALSTSAVLSAITNQVNNIEQTVAAIRPNGADLTDITGKVDDILVHVAGNRTESVTFEPEARPKDAPSRGIKVAGGELYGNSLGGDYYINIFNYHLHIEEIYVTNRPNQESSITIISPDIVAGSPLDRIDLSDFVDGLVRVTVFDITNRGMPTQLATHELMFRNGTVTNADRKISWIVPTEISGVSTTNRSVSVEFENPNRPTLQETTDTILGETRNILDDTEEILSKTPDNKPLITPDGEVRIDRRQEDNIITS